MTPRTLYDKLWDEHVVLSEGERDLLYIDRHMVHEVTSPQAFEGLRIEKRPLHDTHSVLAVADHNVPTKDHSVISDPDSKLQLDTLSANCKDFSLNLFALGDRRQGIVHVVAPEQ